MRRTAEEIVDEIKDRIKKVETGLLERDLIAEARYYLKGMLAELRDLRDWAEEREDDGA